MQTLEAVIQLVAAQLNESAVFFGHGTDNAMDEAHWLVLHTLNLPVDSPVNDYSLVVDEMQIQHIDALLERRIAQRCPLAYLLNSAWFAGLEFYVDERVLVPRSPIAELLMEQFSAWIDPGKVHRMLDLCTGSGCIGIVGAYVFPNAQIVATDLSQDALEVAMINRDRHHLNQQLTLLQSDVFATVEGQFDVIVSNPPYVNAQDMTDLYDEFKAEPALGLAAGGDGLNIVDSILVQAIDYLTPHGILVVEVGNSAPALEAKYPHLPFLWIEFERGGNGVFVLTAEELSTYL